MIMPPRIRKLSLTAHVVSSVGWVGAAVAYVALVVAVMTTPDVRVLRGAYVAMELMAWYVLVPFSLAAFLTGVVQSLGTRWGLFRYWWNVLKLLLTILSIVVLLEFTQSIGHLAAVAAQPQISAGDVDQLRTPIQLLHAGGGLLVLIAATVLAIYKPPGLTRYGQRKQREHVAGRVSDATSQANQ